MTESTRADRFVQELAELKIPDPAAGRGGLWLRAGVALLILGPVVIVLGYLMSNNTSDALVQRDAIIIALGGIALSIVGAALFLRYSLTGVLRYWMARQSYDMAQLAGRLPGEPGRELGEVGVPQR
ncbi:hypothetical protein [Nocardia flavorosea]|uniref:DUF3040 family protein n=1 Tax=Nocardia flavorosea TaxID=53429 RepID=A0A846YFU5_9NOCA|nr:hypothetical protein [Nocardia flavorosea]NKY57605.1 hypothetical protein [Nocardia flavorosea]